MDSHVKSQETSRRGFALRFQEALQDVAECLKLDPKSYMASVLDVRFESITFRISFRIQMQVLTLRFVHMRDILSGDCKYMQMP